MMVAPVPRPLHRLIVFSRLPQLGKVKTRLAAQLGTEQALSVHRQLLAATLDVANGLSWVQRELRYAGQVPAPGDESDRLIRGLQQAGWLTAPQHGPDLGRRMHEALAEALRAGQTPVLIGSDCPMLRTPDLESAFAALQSADAVFSPAEDGGYALVGLARALPALFEQIEWGSAQVMAQTLERARSLGIRVQMLRTVWDVDTPADLLRWQARPGQ